MISWDTSHESKSLSHTSKPDQTRLDQHQHNRKATNKQIRPMKQVPLNVALSYWKKSDCTPRCGVNWNTTWPIIAEATAMSDRARCETIALYELWSEILPQERQRHRISNNYRALFKENTPQGQLQWLRTWGPVVHASVATCKPQRLVGIQNISQYCDNCQSLKIQQQPRVQGARFFLPLVISFA